MDITLLTEVPLRVAILGSILSFAAPIIGGLIGASSAKDTNRSNQAIAAGTNEASIASAREANALTEKLANQANATTVSLAGNANALTRELTGNAITSTEGMTGRALVQADRQFEQSQAFAERMSNTAYTRGIADLKSAGLNPIIAATRGATSTPTVSGGPTASGSGTGGSGTGGSGTGGSGQRASLIAFQKQNAVLQGMNTAINVARAQEEFKTLRLANEARAKYGKGDQADFVETLDKAGADMIPGLLSKHFPSLGFGKGKITQRKLPPHVKSPVKKGSGQKRLNKFMKKNAPARDQPSAAKRAQLMRSLGAYLRKLKPKGFNQ